MIKQWGKKSGRRAMLKTFEMCEMDFAKLKKIHFWKMSEK
jgi:hypothetical protein